MRTKYLLLTGMLAFVIALSGCSVFMAAKQPSKKDLDIIRVGTERDHLIHEFGNPVSSGQTQEGEPTETFRFEQGFSKGLKAGRAVFHGAADILTLGLWEIVGTPTEALWDGTTMTLTVVYDDQHRVKRSRLLKEN